jgi:hypothetical protein
MPEGAMCVQRFDDSLDSAIHITYRVSLRSSSMREPRDPLLKVLKSLDWFRQKFKQMVLVGASGRLTGPQQAEGVLPKQKGRFHGGLTRRPGRSFPPVDLICTPSSSEHMPSRCRQAKGRRREFLVARAFRSRPEPNFLMILPQVHLRKPCYDFYFL